RVRRARVLIVALARARAEFAPGPVDVAARPGGARVVGARVPVVAVGGARATPAAGDHDVLARAAVTDFVRARVAVVDAIRVHGARLAAGQRGSIDAAGRRLASVGRARVVIVTVAGRPGLAARRPAARRRPVAD